MRHAMNEKDNQVSVGVIEAEADNPTREVGPVCGATIVPDMHSYDDLPDEVIDRAKMSILDSLGCAIGGSTLEPAGIILSFLTELKGKPESTLIPKGPKVPTIHAAYANSYLANLMDFDDTGRGHPGACIIPPALAVAERIGASGRELINAVTLAYEVHARIADAITPSTQRDKQVRGVATHETFGAIL